MSSPHSHLDHHNDPNTLHRYHQHQHQHAPSAGPYYHLAHSQPALEPLSTSLPHSSYTSRQQQQQQQPWMLNVQTSYAPQHHQQQQQQQTNALADRTAFYSGTAPEPAAAHGQMVGYPESSQRTPLLPDASSYASLYNTVPYPTVSFPYQQSGYSPTGSSPSDDLQTLDSQTIVRSGGGGGGGFRGVQGMPDRRQTYPPLANPYLDGGRGDLYGPGAPTAARMASQHSAPSLGHLVGGGGSSSYSASHAYAGLGSPGAGYPQLTSDGASSMMDVHSPAGRHASSSGAYPLPIRRDSMDSIADPISPSSVPGLVFDGDDYDDDSESSLPSAASEVHQRVPYRPSQAADDRDFDAGAGSAWSRSSLDGHYGGSSSVSLDGEPSRHHHHHHHHHHHGRSPEPSGGSSSTGSSSGSSDSTSTADRGSPSEAQTTSSSAGAGADGRRPAAAQKKSKMHQCTVCFKLFPRPSGLATHMNSHSGAKPFKCPIPTCTKSFAVRSNAKRHLRTHGIFPSAEHGSTSPSQFTVGFDTPLVSEVHEAGKLPSKLRWVPPSLASRSNIDYLRDAASDSEDEYFQPSCPLLPLPLPPVTPSSPTWNPDDRYEERNSYEQADAAPYISNQWRALPGPAIASPTSF